MKKFLIVVIAILILLAPISYAGSYSPEYEDYAVKLSEIGVFRGTDKGFELDRAPSRQEAAVMFVRLLGAEKDALDKKYSHPFSDVTWASDYVGYLYHEGLTMGTGSDTFGSEDTMSAASYFTFILRSLGYDDSRGDFSWNKSLEFACEKKLIGDADLAELKEKTFLRDHTAKVSYMALKMPLKGDAGTLVEKLMEMGAIEKDKAEKIGVIEGGSENVADEPETQPVQETTEEKEDRIFETRDFGQINGINSFDAISVQKGKYSGIYTSTSKDLLTYIDRDALPDNMKGFKYVLMDSLFIPEDFGSDNISELLKAPKRDIFFSEAYNDANGMARGVGVTNDLLFVLYDAQRVQLGYCFVHLLGVGPSLSFYPDITSDFIKVDFGTVAGAGYFDEVELFRTGERYMTVRINRDSLPESMKGFVYIDIGGVGNSTVENVENLEEHLSKEATHYKVYEFDSESNGIYDNTLIKLYDKDLKLVGYSIFRK